MAWVGYEYRDLKVGDEVIVERSTRWTNEHRRAKITKISETSFWVGSQRFTRSWGRMHGDQSTRAHIFSQEKWNELESRRKSREREEKNKRNAAAEAEQAIRIEYCCDHITDEATQTLLGNLRARITASQSYISRVLDRTNEATPEKPWPLYHAMRDGDHERFLTSVSQYDICRDIHYRLVQTADAFEDGQRFSLSIMGQKAELSKAAGTTLSFVVKHEFRAIVMRMLQEFLRSSRPEVGRREIIDGLMDACGLKYGIDYDLRGLKDEEEAAA